MVRRIAQLFWGKPEEIWEEFYRNYKCCENYRNFGKAVCNNSIKI